MDGDSIESRVSVIIYFKPSTACNVELFPKSGILLWGADRMEQFQSKSVSKSPFARCDAYICQHISVVMGGISTATCPITSFLAWSTLPVTLGDGSKPPSTNVIISSFLKASPKKSLIPWAYWMRSISSCIDGRLQRAHTKTDVNQYFSISLSTPQSAWCGGG